ncbi:DUF6397 family protein [Streptomyces sp. NPDC002004]
MTGNTVTQPAPALSAGSPHPRSVSRGRAARELGLKRIELDLAVHLGRIRTVPDEGGGGGRRVACDEVARVRSAEGFPDALLDEVRTVGTAQGAELMAITPARFTKLARVGLLTPATFYLNRYRAVVWLYLARELRQFAAAEINRPLLAGRTPHRLLTQLDAGVDRRARNWRSRRAGSLLRQTDDPWKRAAITASMLGPVQVADLVRDPYERALLNRLRPDRPVRRAPDSPAAQVVARLLTADDPDEIQLLRTGLGLSLAEARRKRPAPRSTPPAAPPADDERTPPPTEDPEGTSETTASARGRRTHGLLTWLRRTRR